MRHRRRIDLPGIVSHGWRAQPPFQTLIVGVDHRAVTSLNGDWHYLVDQSPGRALYNAKGEINDNS